MKKNKQKNKRSSWDAGTVVVIIAAILLIGGCLLLSGIACDGNGIMTCIG